MPHRLTHRFLDRAGFECYVNFFDLHRLAERTLVIGFGNARTIILHMDHAKGTCFFKPYVHPACGVFYCILDKIAKGPGHIAGFDQYLVFLTHLNRPWRA